MQFSRPIPNRLLVISLLGSETNSQIVKILDSKTPPKFQTCHQKISSATSMKSRQFRGLTSRVQNSKLRRSVPVWRKIYSILLIYCTLWKLDLNNLYGAWFNIMTQQKVVVNLAFKYTHEVCVQNHANYLKLHYFPRHTWVTSVKINISDVRCLSVGRIARPKFEFFTNFQIIFDYPESSFFRLVREICFCRRIVRSKSCYMFSLSRLWRFPPKNMVNFNIQNRDFWFGTNPVGIVIFLNFL